MNLRSRVLWRLRHFSLRTYEVLLYLSLAAMVAAIAWPASASADADDEAHCGNSHSSTVVMAR